MLWLVSVALLSASAAASDTLGLTATVKSALSPFTSVDIGYRGCMPLSVSVVSGSDYYFTVSGVTAEVSNAISANVSPDGTCILTVKSPGFSDVSGAALTITVPDNTLRSVAVGGSANVYLSVQPAMGFTVSTYGQGWVKVEPSQSVANSDIRVFASGMNTVAVCPKESAVANSLDVHNSGSGNVVVEQLSAGRSNVELSGTGPISLLGNAPSRSSGHVSLSGSSYIIAAAEQVGVDLRGMGDIYLNGAKNVKGSLSGMGNVHVPNDASCFLSTTGMGNCDQNNNPPYPPASCNDFSQSGIDSANAAHWTVSVRGNSCSSSSSVRGVLQATVETEMDVITSQVGVTHGHRVADPCCTTGFSYTGTHCITNGEHHRCCVEGGTWTCGKGDVVEESFVVEEEKPNVIMTAAGALAGMLGMTTQ